ncbi:MAG TPA: hypothetical protein VD866_26090 [Urbifossiella sp.]|nr:hypothetical protein [Urbifossiella sp.]
MRRVTCLLVLLGAVAAADARPPAAWVTVTGRVVLPAGLPVPPPKFLQGFPGVPDETVLIDPKTRGVRNVVLWLRPDNEDRQAKLAADEIHPDDRLRPVHTHVIEYTPKLVFAPRVVATRPGDSLTVQNLAAQPTNFLWNSANNGNLNALVPPGGVFPFPAPLVMESALIPYKSNLIPTGGVVRVFEHPYYAVTDADGRFELKNAPAGKYRLVTWHEKVGFKDGRAGRFGERVEIVAGKDGTMALPAIGFDVR